MVLQASTMNGRDVRTEPVEESVQLWNRMSSGSYLPPPVKQVEIPKAKGGTIKLGIPTVSDRIAQTVVKRIIEPRARPDLSS